jgi:heterodisulfide reductase subunit B
MKLTSKILREAKDAGAECIVVACHLCHMNLDLRQRDTERKYREEFNLPIFYFTELLGLALGINYKQLGLKKHFINPIKFLKGKNLI